MPSSWFQAVVESRLRSRLARFFDNRPKNTPLISRPRLEPMESRALLSTVTWDGGGDNLNWTDPLNWSNDALPTIDDDVEINAGEGMPSSIHLSESSPQSIRSMVIQIGLTVWSSSLRIVDTLTAHDEIMLWGTSTLEVQNTADFYNSISLYGYSTLKSGQWNHKAGDGITTGNSTLLDHVILNSPLNVRGLLSVKGDLHVNGLIKIDAMPPFIGFYFQDAKQSITGNARMSGNYVDFTLGTDSTPTQLTIADTIEIESFQCTRITAAGSDSTVIHQGLIKGSLSVYSKVSSFTNQGTILASSHNYLELLCPVDNTDGLIDMGQTRSSNRLQAGQITGGTLRGNQGYSIYEASRLSVTELISVTLEDSWQISGYKQTTEIHNGIVINGTLAVTSGYATLNFAPGDQTISGKGILEAVSGSTLTISIGSTTQNASVTISSGMTLRAEGTIEIVGADSTTTSTFTNNGSITITHGYAPNDSNLWTTPSLDHFINAGSINSIDASYARITIDNYDFKNSGTIALDRNGRIYASLQTNITNTGGLIQLAMDGFLSGTNKVIGGTIRSTATGRWSPLLSSVGLDSVLIEGEFKLTNTARLFNTNTLNGQLTNSTGASILVTSTPQATLTGTGAVNVAALRLTIPTGFSLTLDSNITTRVGATLSAVGSGTLINRGKLEFARAASGYSYYLPTIPFINRGDLYIVPGVSVKFGADSVNESNITLGAGASIALDTMTFTNKGTITLGADATIRGTTGTETVSAGTLKGPADPLVNPGQLHSLILDAVTLAGRTAVAPGVSISSVNGLKVDDDFYLTSDGTLAGTLKFLSPAQTLSGKGTVHMSPLSQIYVGVSDPADLTIDADTSVIGQGQLLTAAASARLINRGNLQATPYEGLIQIVPPLQFINANHRPGFTVSGPLPLNVGSAAQTVSQWLTFNPGNTLESDQTPTYQVSNISDPSFFLVTPTIDANGTLRYTPMPFKTGVITFDVQVTDNGGTEFGGINTSLTQTFTLTLDTTPPRVLNFQTLPPTRTTPLGSIQVTFSEAIRIDSFTHADLTLTRNAGVNLITSAAPVAIELVSGTTYLITGLSDLTRYVGAYQLTLRDKSVNDNAGNSLNAAESVAWTATPADPSAPALTAESTNGENLTFDNTPDVTGTATPGTVLDLWIDGAKSRSMNVGSAGTYAFTLPALTDGVHSLTAISTVNIAGVDHQSQATSTITVNAGRILSATPLSNRSTPVTSLTFTTNRQLNAASLDAADILLTRNGQPLSTAGAVLTFATGSGSSWTYRVTLPESLTADAADYQLTLQGAGMAAQATGYALTNDLILSWTNQARYLSITTFAVPRTTPLNQIAITTSHRLDLSSISAADMTLTRNGQPVSAATITVAAAAAGSNYPANTYFINLPSALSTDRADYQLTILGASVKTATGQALSNDIFTTWTNQARFSAITPFPAPRTTPVPSVTVTFNTLINPATLTADDLLLTLNGQPVSLPSVGVSVTASSGTHAALITLPASAVTAPGQYVLTVVGANIHTPIDTPIAGQIATTWTMNAALTSVVQYTVPRNSPLPSTIFTTNVAVDLAAIASPAAAVTLTRNGQPRPTEGVTIEHAGAGYAPNYYRILLPAQLSSDPGTYVLTILGAQIPSVYGPAFVNDMSTTWTRA